MVTAITRFKLPDNVNIDDVKRSFLEVAPKFRDVEGLIRKQFIVSGNGSEGGGIYLWRDRASAERFLNEVVVGMIEAAYHVTPTVEFFDTAVVVDNVSGQITT
jgi:hypothetical protein